MLANYFCSIPEYAENANLAAATLEDDGMLKGERIKYALEASGVDPRQVAAACGISVQAVYSWLRGQTKDLRNEHLFCLADVTSFSPRWIATGEGPQRRIVAEDPRILHAVKVMENMNDYLVDRAVKDIEDLADLAKTLQRAGGRK